MWRFSGNRRRHFERYVTLFLILRNEIYYTRDVNYMCGCVSNSRDVERKGASKTRTRNILAGSVGMLALAALSLHPATALGGDFYWDGDGNSAGNNKDGSGLGGSGSWDTASNQWWNGFADTIWMNGGADVAIFTAPYLPDAPIAKTVSVSGGIIANQLRFMRSGYALSGGIITLGGSSAGLFAGLGESAVVSSLVQGNAGLLKAGVAASGSLQGMPTRVPPRSMAAR